ncbi:MAG: TlpA disulfide reductase family protein [Erythrobacter sp.]|jgi:thiol-disulfide isomerase/thioredoxin|nr:TlpA disulfide reductase family protein [Erythrobacter sp.]
MMRSLLVLVLGALALGACDRGGEDSAQAGASQTAEAPAPPPLPGEPVRSFAGSELPALTLEDTQGRMLDLGALERPALINLWATWCAPCVVEMPMLDDLAVTLEGEVDVLTISQDVRGAEVVAPFFAERDFAQLQPWLDPQSELAATFAEGGLLPTTILFDADGREILRVAGAYDWDSEEAVALVREAAAQGQ